MPHTLVTYAEFVWARSAEKTAEGKKRYTQDQMADMLGWSREKLKDYSALAKISNTAWQNIGATFEQSDQSNDNSMAPLNGATAPFSERLLRSILDLRAPQQLSLVQQLANEDIKKARFKDMSQDGDDSTVITNITPVIFLED